MSTTKAAMTGVLSPVERFSEILFGLIMTLSITGTLSVVTGGRQEVTTTILSILGCNLAWGIIDAILYLLGTASERGRGDLLFNSIRNSDEPGQARAAIAEALPPVVAEVMVPDEIEALRQRLARLPPRPRSPMLTPRDLVGGLGVFLLVVLSCIPLIVPFLLIQNPVPALRVSNAVAIVMLFAGGYSLAKFAGTPKVRTGGLMVLLGVSMVGITIALGG